MQTVHYIFQLYFGKIKKKGVFCMKTNVFRKKITIKEKRGEYK